MNNNFDLKFGKNDHIELNNMKLFIIRMSYVGELGYELHIPENKIVEIYNLLMEYGRKYNLKDAGYGSLETLSMEKGYKHFHSDISTKDTPIEAGLNFICKKDIEYIGKNIIDTQKKNGIKRKLVCLSINEQKPIYGNETIYKDNIPIGFIKRGGYSYSLNQPFGYGYITNNNNYIDNDFLESGQYELEILGKKYKANYESKVLFDPDNNRLKGIYE